MEYFLGEFTLDMDWLLYMADTCQKLIFLVLAGELLMS